MEFFCFRPETPFNCAFAAEIARSFMNLQPRLSNIGRSSTSVNGVLGRKQSTGLPRPQGNSIPPRGILQPVWSSRFSTTRSSWKISCSANWIRNLLMKRLPKISKPSAASSQSRESVAPKLSPSLSANSLELGLNSLTASTSIRSRLNSVAP